MSFSQIAIASLMIGAPVQPTMAQYSVQPVDTPPPAAVQLGYRVPVVGPDIVAIGSDQAIEDAVQQAAEPSNATGALADSASDDPESRALDPPPDSLASTPQAPVNDQPDEEDNIITVTARPETPADPLMELNADAFDVVQDVDQAVVEPVAMAYKKAVPEPIRDGLRNFLRNLGEPVVFFNYLLQLKPGKAAETLGRFAINTTIGIGGLFDAAKKPPFYLPHRSNGFANTFGYYGIEPGPFLFLPLAGPTTVRDLVGGGLNLLFLPTIIGKPFTERALTVPIGILSALDKRIEFDDQINAVRSGKADPYTTAREFYLNQRQTEIDILRGRIADPLSRKSREIGPPSSPAFEPIAPEAMNSLASELHSGRSSPVEEQESETETAPTRLDPSAPSKEPLLSDPSRAPPGPHSPPGSGGAIKSR